MAVTALLLSIVSALAAVGSALWAKHASRAAVEADRRARTPELTVIGQEDHDAATSVFYRIRNDGPADLESIVVYRPVLDDGLVYDVAVLGDGWAENGAIELGPLAMTRTAAFQLACGLARPWPDFHVKITATRNRTWFRRPETWNLVRPLPDPRNSLARFNEFS